MTAVRQAVKEIGEVAPVRHPAKCDPAPPLQLLLRSLCPWSGRPHMSRIDR